MNQKSKFLVVILTIILGILVACGNQSDDRNENQSTNNATPGNATDSEKAANSNDQVKESDQSSKKGNDVDSSNETSKKEEYLKKLDALDKEIEGMSTDGTQLEMLKVETDIFNRWDTTLNEIYGVLKEQLSTSEMDKLKEEQRNWIVKRDESAKKESLQFEGGSMESLTFVATQAKITKERCYELVEDYMK